MLAEVTNPGTASQKWTDYLAVGNAKVGMRTLQSASALLTTRYFHTDHLGSISVITDENALVVERLSYDAWGKRRNPDGTDDTTGSVTSQSTRGFTGEEQLSIGGLVHLNGRVYDPLLARFTSADPTVTDPMNMQGWNRYSYVGNDPLAFTDPNGFSWLSSFFHSVSKGFTAIGNFFKQNFMSILQIALNVALNVATGFACIPCVAAASSAIVTGISGGNLGQILKAAAIAAVTSYAFQQIGPTPSFASNPSGYVASVGANAVVGCASSVASGGSCQSGALAAGVGAALSPATRSMFQNPLHNAGDLIGGTIVQATAGGLASVAGGGKFANGAVTAGFQYLAAVSAEAARQSWLDANAQMTGGAAPNDRHELARQIAMQDARDLGYTIISSQETRVFLPGFPSRIYDFVAYDPSTGSTIGAEVKTTIWDTIRLNSTQVTFDVAVANGQLGPAIGSGVAVDAVQYYTYCGGCWPMNGKMMSAALGLRLELAGIPVMPPRAVKF